MNKLNKRSSNFTKPKFGSIGLKNNIDNVISDAIITLNTTDYNYSELINVDDLNESIDKIPDDIIEEQIITYNEIVKNDDDVQVSSGLNPMHTSKSETLKQFYKPVMRRTKSGWS
jgi:hypothetical protein